jgi:glycosyltransferase involved in cell wall biosynthesis
MLRSGTAAGARMKLLFLVKTLGPLGGRGGAERVLSEIASRLSARGHDIVLVTFDAPGEEEVYSFAPEIERIKLGIGASHRRSGVRDTIGRTRKMRELIVAIRPDVAIGFMHSAYVPLGLALAGTGIPVVASEHIVYQHYRTRPLQRAILLAVPPLLAAITAISEPVRSGFPWPIRRKMAIIPNPVAPPSPLLADTRGGARKTLLTVGRLMDQKDHRTLIAAFASIAAKHPDWDLRIIGEGPLRPELEAQVVKLGLEDRVRMPGITTEIAREYAAAQLFVMPSKFESFGLATAEALSQGLPAVGYADDAGTSVLVRDGVNGILVAGPDRVEALAGGLDRAMASPELRAQLGAEAPATMRAYDPETIAGEWEKLLASVHARSSR